MSNILKGLNEGRSYGRDSWDSNMPGYQGDYGGAANWGRRNREDDEHHEIDAVLAARHAQRQEYERNGKFWLKLKDSQRHLPAGPFTGKQAANIAAVELLKQQPELKGNLLITAYGPDETQGVAEGSKEKTPGIALSKAYKKDFDDKKPGQDRKETALTGAYSKTGKPGGELKKQGVAEDQLDEAKIASSEDEDFFHKGKKVGSITKITLKDGMVYYRASAGNSHISGSDTRQEALRDLKELLRREKQQGVAEGLSKRDQKDVDAIKAAIERLQAQLSHPNADKAAIQQSIEHEKKRLALYGQGVAEGSDKDNEDNNEPELKQTRAENEFARTAKQASKDFNKWAQDEHKKQKGVAEGSTGVSVRKWANQVRKDHGADVKFWNRKEGGGAVDSVVAKNSSGEVVGVYNRKTGYPTVFEPKQGVAEVKAVNGGFPFDVDHMNGSRGIGLDWADTRDLLQKPFEHYGNYKEWYRDVNRVNSELLDDNAEYTTMAGGKIISINGKEFAWWSNRNGNGSIDIGIAKKHSGQGVAEGSEEGFSIEDMVTDQYRNGNEVWEIASNMGMSEDEVQDIINDSEQGVTEGSDERSQNRLWQMITDYEQRAKATKNDIKKDHYLKMASELRGKLKTSDEQGVAEDQLDELSNKTLASYKKKAGADASQADKRGDYARGDKRMSGIIKATKKEFDNDAKGIEEEKQRLDPKCWDGYKKQGTKMKGDTRVNNCVPVKESAIMKGLK